ncbi:MAG: Ldh family oxidoreductase [Bacteroidota bacterium]
MSQSSTFSTLGVSDLTAYTISIFKAIGCSDYDAALAADVLIKADLRGIDSHGVARLSGYVRLYENNRINTRPNIHISKEKASVFTIDGDGGLGLVVAPRAMEIAIEKTGLHGSGFGAVKNSNHFGIAAYHAMMALEKHYIGMAMTNASPLVAPTYSKERMLGTNPICYAIPAGKHPAFILDMATSAAANGKLEIAERQNKPVPEGWLETKNGLPTTNPKDLKEGGHLLPLGSDKDHGSHKGYGLGALVDILSGVLPGANFGPWVPPFVAFLPVLPDLPGKGLGHFVGAMDISGFDETDAFLNRMDLWIDRFKNAIPVDESKKVIIHGEPEYTMHQERKINGIPLIDKVTNDLKALAIKYHLDHPF